MCTVTSSICYGLLSVESSLSSFTTCCLSGFQMYSSAAPDAQLRSCTSNHIVESATCMCHPRSSCMLGDQAASQLSAAQCAFCLLPTPQVTMTMLDMSCISPLTPFYRFFPESQAHLSATFAAGHHANPVRKPLSSLPESAHTAKPCS